MRTGCIFFDGFFRGVNPGLYILSAIFILLRQKASKIELTRIPAADIKKVMMSTPNTEPTMLARKPRKPRQPMTAEAKATMTAKRLATREANRQAEIGARLGILPKSLETTTIDPSTIVEAFREEQAVSDSITEAIEDNGDRVLALLFKHAARDYVWYLHGPVSTSEYHYYDNEAEHVLEIAGKDCPAWGYTLTKRHGCINIWCGSDVVHGCWLRYLQSRFGDMDNIQNLGVDVRTWFG